jgi:hypothetical protein
MSFITVKDGTQIYYNADLLAFCQAAQQKKGQVA